MSMDNGSSSTSSLPWALHDFMSLGEVEQGLSTAAKSKEEFAPQEIQRLPMFLRLLSTTRDLVSLSILDSANSATTANEDDPLVHRTVERLEHVAAIHSVAEGVDVVTCYLAPSMTRRLSRVPPLVRNDQGVLDTTELIEVARSPKSRGSAGRSSKKQKTSDPDAADDSDDDDDDGESSSGGFSDNGSEQEGGSEEGESSNGKKRKRKGGFSSSTRRRDSLEAAAEDSQEVTVVKTLSELVSLVAMSLDPIVEQHGSDDHQHNHHSKETTSTSSRGDHGDLPASEKPHFSHGGTAVAASGKGHLALTIEDSIITETGRDGTGGAMELSDLGSTVAAIMHHAPVLRSRHVANALCRASIPQSANLLTRMGANCPASVPSLLLGCIQAYQLAISHQNKSIVNVAKQGVLALAQLSPREKSRVVHKLHANGIMWDVQLELNIQDPVVDSTAAANILVHQIIASTLSTTRTAPYTKIPRRSLEREQSAGEEPSDDYQKLEDDDDRKASSPEPTLLSLLFKRQQLYRNTLEFLVEQFLALSRKKRLPRGQLVLFLKAYNCLLLCPTATSAKFDRSKVLVETVIPALQALTDKVLEILLRVGKQPDLPATCDMDSLVENLQCAVLLSTARISQGGPFDDQRIETCQDLNMLLGELPCPSQRVQGFRRGIEAAMTEELPSVVHAQILGVLTSHQSRPASRNIALVGTLSDIAPGLYKVCSLFKPLNPVKIVEDEDDTLDDLETTISSLMFRMDEEEAGDIDELVEATLRTILTSDNVSVLTCVENDDLLPQFVAKATQRLVSKEELLHVPMILSVPLERQSSVLLGYRAERKDLDDACAKFLLRLLHAFEYLNAKPNSPFAFDPRSLPLKRALEASLLWSGDFLQTRLYELSSVHCMDVVSQLERAQMIGLASDAETSMFCSMSRQQAVEAFYKALRSFLVDIESDTEACGSETVFLQAKISLPDADLCSTVCSAFLASPHKPRPTFTYHVLCMDPLLLFKCPVKIWKSRGLRRIALSVLSSLLESNAVLVHEASPLDCSAKEFLAARDIVVVRCLLTCVGGVESEVEPSDCTMTSSFIRSIISVNEGVVATLIKQGLSERAVDWLVEYVPECLNDSQAMQKLLSDRTSLTAAERLVAADVVLRIAIVHGQSNEEEATKMAYSALAQLVDSFFLVVGPVGVPVNALIVDDSGLDVTQISRKAAFRILRALMRVRGRRVGLRKECGMALQKLAGLCKSESAVAGVAGAVAGRRKQLLKEIYDLCIKAATNMGIAIGAQPATG